MITKNAELLKLEDDLLQEINALKKVYLEELKKLTTVYNLQSFAKIYKPLHDVNKDGYSIDNNIQENIEFVNEAIAHQLTSFVMVEKLQMKLIKDIFSKINDYKFELDEEKGLIQNKIDKEKPKNILNKVKNIVFSKSVSKELLEQKSINGLKVKYIESIDSKIRKINPNTVKNGKSDHLQLLKMTSFEEINHEIKNRMKSSKIISSLEDEMDTYRLSERYDKILAKYPLKLEKLFTKHIGDDLSKQLMCLKDNLDNQVLKLTEESSTLDNILSNIAMIESNVIKGFLVKPIDFAKEKSAGFKSNIRELGNPEERNKKFGSIVMGIIALACYECSKEKVFNTFGINSKTEQHFISNAVDKITDKDSGLISLLSDDLTGNNLKIQEVEAIVSEHLNNSKSVKRINNADKDFEL